MEQQSFYSFDYLISINEKRAEQYLTAYQKVIERFTNIILIYSAITIFLITIIQDIFFGQVKSIIMYICFVLFAGLFLTSLIFTIKLIIPVQVAYLDAPDKYYKDIRIQYEQSNPELDEKAINKLIKGSYILELEEAVKVNNTLFKRKSSFFYNSLLFGLLCAIPYMVCLGYHISKKDKSVQQIEIVNHK